MNADEIIYAVAGVRCDQDHDAGGGWDEPCDIHIAELFSAFGLKRVSPNSTPVAAALNVAKEYGLYRECDWCKIVDIIVIDSTAGARCSRCAQNPLCDWCGEAPMPEDDDHCKDCRETQTV